MSLQKDSLLLELDRIYKDAHEKISKNPLISRFVKIEEIILFVGKVVKKVESIEKENDFLKEEIHRLGQEIVRLNHGHNLDLKSSHEKH